MISIALIASLSLSLGQTRTESTPGPGPRINADMEVRDVDVAQYASLIRTANLEVKAGRFDAAKSTLANCKPAIRHWEHDFLSRLCEKKLANADQLAASLSLDEWVDSYAFSPDGRKIVSTHRETLNADKKVIPCEVQLWDLASRRKIFAIPQTSWFVVFDINPASDRIAVGGNDGVVAVFDATKGSRLMSAKLFAENAESKYIAKVLFLAGGNHLLCVGANGTAKRIDAKDGKILQELDAKEKFGFLAISPDFQSIVSGGRFEKLAIFDVATLKEKKILQKPIHSNSIDPYTGHPWLLCAAFSKDAKQMAAGSGRNDKLCVEKGKEIAMLGPSRGRIEIWDMASGKNLQVFDSLPLPICSVSFSADGKRLAGVDGEQLTLWDIATGAEVFRMPVPTYRVQFSPVGRCLSWAEGKQIRFWDPMAARESTK
jgi:WD40 repeat protein